MSYLVITLSLGTSMPVTCVPDLCHHIVVSHAHYFLVVEVSNRCTQCLDSGNYGESLITSQTSNFSQVICASPNCLYASIYLLINGLVSCWRDHLTHSTKLFFFSHILAHPHANSMPHLAISQWSLGMKLIVIVDVGVNICCAN